jgi:hypothetical protein
VRVRVCDGGEVERVARSRALIPSEGSCLRGELKRRGGRW